MGLLSPRPTQTTFLCHSMLHLQTTWLSARHSLATHRGDNGAHQVIFGQTLAGTQNTAMWNPETDSIDIGDDDHYGTPLSRWDFVPLVKGHIPDFKIAAR